MYYVRQAVRSAICVSPSASPARAKGLFVHGSLPTHPRDTHVPYFGDPRALFTNGVAAFVVAALLASIGRKLLRPPLCEDYCCVLRLDCAGLFERRRAETRYTCLIQAEQCAKIQPRRGGACGGGVEGKKSTIPL